MTTTPRKTRGTRRRAFGIAPALLLGWGLLGSAAPAAAQDFPSKPIKFVVPFPPGSGTDTSARYFARKLNELTGQPVVVENKPGANGFIAVKAVLAAPADGYTVFVGSNSTLAVNVALFKQLPYDPVADLAPLTMMMRSPALVVVPGNSEYKTLPALVAGAKARPGVLNYGAGSAGYQLMSELFNDAARVQTAHVPFKGAAEAVIAVVSGTVNFAFAEITSVQELARSGKVHALAVASDRRVPALPEVPTAAEAGLPGFTAYTWVAGMVSAKTPKAETEKLAALLTKIEKMPETREFYERIGAEVMQGGPEEMRNFQSAEIQLWKRIAVTARVEQQ
ncbi:Tripartite-type tricarboxylate transporter, receptor component TctC [Variovorax sp. PDC80]|uniref:Bug family tripartite tricarboxylate transporter substrate binding protein n=1 Tax=Variovorax sp. PDC80 TaxID=1882827 RepID=UPI0008E685A3|nr:tripartite tricarboxylate transporter substrate binding protein [Variovorax sp. PDC80]SFN97789.1 Tripartite-type tricarboxylate transporter, receptor component TctC [Variovorax sp. PDC80]